MACTDVQQVAAICGELNDQALERCPVFGIVKSVIGFQRFLLRGLEKVSLEWMSVRVA
jgi:hypothetical protein